MSHCLLRGIKVDYRVQVGESGLDGVLARGSDVLREAELERGGGKVGERGGDEAEGDVR